MSQYPFRYTDSADSARAGILRREALGDISVSPRVQAGLDATFGPGTTPEVAVRAIVDAVRASGDAALLDYSQRIEGVLLESVRVPAQALDDALDATDPELRVAIKTAIAQVRTFHERQPCQTWLEWQEGGALGQLVLPLERVGVYVPGGTAPLASSLIMAAVPAQVAGVPEIIACCPPTRATNLPHGTVLATAALLGIRDVFALGGAQAIAAMALGTETVPRVDKVAGPGNIFVVLAKRALYGTVGIESLPGPTETVIVADESADPATVAADMLAQAEHDMAHAIVLTTSADLVSSLAAAVAQRIADPEHEGLRASLLERGGVVLCTDLAEAMALANDYAPEHLCLLTADPWSLLPLVRNAGGVFVGEESSEALGDFALGPSHIMPTGGTARFSSPVNVWDFVKITSVFAAGKSLVRRVSPAAERLAQAEGLHFHAAAIRHRLEATGE